MPSTPPQSSASGLKLGGLKIDVDKAAIGSGLAALRLAGIEVTYDGQNRFTGTARVSLPPTPLVGLDRVAFSYVRKPDSRLFQGEVFLLAGPRFAGNRLAAIDLAARFASLPMKPMPPGRGT